MEIKNICLTKVYLSDKSKDGKAFLTKAGKPYKKITVKCQEYGNEYLSAFIFDERSELLTWKENETHKVIVEKNGQYLNFKLPTRLDELEIRIERIEDMLLNEDGSKVLNVLDNATSKADEATNESDLPF